MWLIRADLLEEAGSIGYEGAEKVVKNVSMRLSFKGEELIIGNMFLENSHKVYRSLHAFVRVTYKRSSFTSYYSSTAVWQLVR